MDPVRNLECLSMRHEDDPDVQTHRVVGFSYVLPEEQGWLGTKEAIRPRAACRESVGSAAARECRARWLMTGPRPTVLRVG